MMDGKMYAARDKDGSLGLFFGALPERAGDRGIWMPSDESTENPATIPEGSGMWLLCWEDEPIEVTLCAVSNGAEDPEEVLP